MTEEAQSTHVDTPLTYPDDVPEVFVDGYEGYMGNNFTTKLNWYSRYFDPTAKESRRRVVLRMTMPTYVMLQVHAALGDAIQELKRVGAVPDDAFAVMPKSADQADNAADD